VSTDGSVPAMDGMTVAGTLAERMGITISEASPHRVVGSMPVEGNTQPYGLLHGGASCVLAETLGSIGAALHAAARDGAIAVGIDINANHVRGVTKGTVTGTARPIHVGRSTHVWEIRIEDEHQRLICIARLTVAIVPRQVIAPPA